MVKRIIMFYYNENKRIERQQGERGGGRLEVVVMGEEN